MPSTFHVISLGNLAEIDSVEGNMIAETANALVGQVFGGPGDALVNHVQVLSTGTQGFAADGNSYYDMDGSSAEAFRLDGGPDQVFDGTSIYGATLTYVDGTTAQISAVVFQDVDGNTYLSPEFSADADQIALEAKPIQSLSLDSLLGNEYSGMTGSRERFDYVACFAAGTRISTVFGDCPIEVLQIGDLVQTRDHGAQPIRWIGFASGQARDGWVPVRVDVGALGQGLPQRHLVLSQQHGLLVASRVAARMTGQDEVLVAANKLVGLPGISLASDVDHITYFHLMFDRHEIIFAEGAPAESLLWLPQRGGAEQARDVPERSLTPDRTHFDRQPARFVPKGQIQRGLARRHLKNGQPLL